MILYKTNYIGVIFGAIKLALKAVYKILKIFNIPLLVIIALGGLALYFGGVFDGDKGAVIVYAIIACGLEIAHLCNKIFKPMKGGRKKEKRRKAEILSVPITPPTQATAEQTIIPTPVTVVAPPEQPKYYKVKNSSYYMAEFSDRYELYSLGEKGLIKIRTDYKGVQDARY